jgi:four helix bundle protein
MDDLKDRTKQFAIRVIKLCSSLPRTSEHVVIGKQLMRSASSVGANYRSACRGKSRADFIAKLSVVEEEADESIYWMELLEALGQTPKTELTNLKDEANQLVSIIVASKKTARRRNDE